MSAFVIDESLPKSLAQSMADRDFPAIDVRDVGLRGLSDEEIYQFVRSKQAILITTDIAFANRITIGMDIHDGILLVRIPNQIDAQLRVEKIVQFIEDHPDFEYQNALVVISMGQVRIRRSKI